VLAVALPLVCGNALAATDAERIDELERKLNESAALVKQLSQRVQELEKGGPRAQAAPAPAPAPVPAPAATAPATDPLANRVKDLEQQVSALSNQPDTDHGIELHGFADVGFTAAGPGRESGAHLGALDFYLTPRLTDRIKFLFELNFECCDDGAIGTDLERMQIGYTVNDNLTVWAGRFHTPFGYWNTAFHHGAQLQTTILRPKFLDFEDSGGIIPAHTVGLWATGSVKTDGGRLGYDVYGGNAPTIHMEDPAAPGTGQLDPGLAGAGGRAATIGANVYFAFRGAAEGLRVGVHGLSTKVSDNALIPNTTRVTMFGGWLAYLENDWEVLAEEYAFRDSDLSGTSGSHASNAWYAQVGRQFGQWVPYARYEVASLDQADPYFAQQESGQSYKRVVGGVRYDLTPKTALKLEAQRTRLTDRLTGDYTELRGQVAVRF
jgi:hypothetical protein